MSLLRRLEELSYILGYATLEDISYEEIRFRKLLIEKKFYVYMMVFVDHEK